jgi:diguanylate cyclase (GGDEF)-like protein
MPADPNTRLLLASASARLISVIRPALLDSGASVEVASSARAILDALRDPAIPSLVLLDADLPGMNIHQLLAAIHSAGEARPFPLVLISAGMTPEWLDRLAEGVIDDLIVPDNPPSHWRLRVDLVLRAFRTGRELAHLRETAALDARTDPLTGLYSRAALLSMLFRETDRVQRMKTSLCVVVFGVDDFAHWNGRLGAAACDECLRQMVDRVRRLLRSYDLFGRVGRAEFVLGLPGCSLVNAVCLAERIRADVYSAPFSAGGVSVRLTAGFGIASSRGRSPVVVLREAERALQSAQAAGPESIRTGAQRESSQRALCADRIAACPRSRF